MFTAPTAFGGGVLTDYDLYTYFYPYWDYRAAALLDGRLPLWNPDLFTGVPFLANAQTGVLYLPNLLFLGQSASQAVNWSYVLHIWLACAGMYLFLRRGAGTGLLGAWAGGLAFGLGGFFAAQAGHINQIQAAAWLPWLALAFYKAHEGRSVRWLVAGGVALGLQITAGHPQETFFSLVALAALAGYLALLSHRAGRGGPPGATWRRVQRLPRPAVAVAYSGLLLAGVLALGLGLAAAQLLPALELAARSIRAGGLPYPEAVSFSLPPWELLRAFLPTYHDPPFSEYVAYTGAAALMTAAIAAPWWGKRYSYNLTAYFAGLTVAGVVFALGRYLPIYELFYDHLPGFALFRVPARWLFLAAFGLAGLAGLGIDALAAGERLRVERAQLSNRLFTLGAGLLLMGAVALVFPLVARFTPLELPPPDVMLWWAGAGGGALLIIVLGRFVVPGRAAAVLLLLIIGAELYFARLPYPISHPVPGAVDEAAPPTVNRLREDPGLYRVLSIAGLSYEPQAWQAQKAELSKLLPPREVAAIGTVSKFNATLTPNIGLRFGIPLLDGYDGGLLPTHRHAQLKRLLLDSGGIDPLRPPTPVGAAALIRDHIAGIPSADLLGLLNVKYLIDDRINDPTVDGVFYDLGLPVRLSGQASYRLEGADWGPATALGLATYLDEGGSIAEGAPIATVTVIDHNGRRMSWELHAGVDTFDADAVGRTGAAPRAVRAIATGPDGQGGRVFLTTLPFDGQATPRSLTIASHAGPATLVIAGASFINRETGKHTSLTLDPRWQRIYLGDLKIYRNRVAQARAFFTAEATVVRGEDAQLRALPHLRSGQAVLDALTMPERLPQGPAPAASAHTVVTTRYEPERLQVVTDQTHAGFLVLNDSYFPGWRAWVDGQETPIIRANYLFRAVALPPGQHSVEFRYEPQSFLTGLRVTLGTAALTVMLLLGSFLRRRWDGA